MPRIFKKFFSFSSFKSIVVIIFLMAFLRYASGHFIFARASSDQMNIYPDTFSLEQDDALPIWRNAGLAFYPDLSPQADFKDFNLENSASIVVNPLTANQPVTGPSTDTLTENIPAAVEESIEPEAEITPAESLPAPLDSAEINPSENAPAAEPGAVIEEAVLPAPEPVAEPIMEEVPAASPEPAPVEAGPAPAADIPTSLLNDLKLAAKGVKIALSSLVSFSQARANEATREKSPGQSIVFSGFSVPITQKDLLIDNVQLRLSLSGRSTVPGDIIRLAYSLGDSAWEEAGTIDIAKEVSNVTNGGYFLFGLPAFSNWDDVGRLNFKVTYPGVGPAEGENGNLEAYIDAVWLEVSTRPAPDASPDADGDVAGVAEFVDGLIDLGDGLMTANDEYDFKLTTDKKDFKAGENLQFGFDFKKKRGLLGTIGFGFLDLFYDEYKNIDIRTEVAEAGGTRRHSVYPAVEYQGDGRFSVDIRDLPRQFRPGKHSLKVAISDKRITDGKPAYFTQDFSWGVLAFNTSKSIYLPAETVYLQMGVLDDLGHTLCNADVELEITAPDGGVAYMNTGNGLIMRNPECGPDNVIDSPDYSAYYGLAGSGDYQVRLIAHTVNGDREIVDRFEVRDSVPFDIERTGPTRVYPLADYEMKINIKANEDYSGDIIDIVPAGFKIKNAVYSMQYAGDDSGSLHTTYRILNTDNGEQQIIFSDIDLKPGDVAELKYTIDFPDISPEFFLLGPLSVGSFEEIRKWQIASDALASYDANNGSSAGTWTTPTNAWNSSNNNYGARDVISGADETTIYIQSTGNTATDIGSVITKVEIGIEGYVERTFINARLRPVYNGSTLGTTTYTILGTTLTTSDTDATFYVDITYDGGAPASWTWNDIINLDVRVHGQNTGASQRMLYIDQIRYRVTYSSAPTSTIASAVQKIDGSGTVDISVLVNDLDGDNSRGKLEFATGTTCVFSSPGDPTLDATDANATSTFGDAKIDNASAYQVGTSTGWILTSSGENTVNFDWLSKTDLPDAEGEYCIRFTANDQAADQTTPATTTLLIDNKAPTAPGALSVDNVIGTDVTLDFGSLSTDTYFKEYKIFYSTSSVVMDSGAGMYEFSSSTSPGDADLGQEDFNSTATTTISGLDSGTLYYFNIFAYDQNGNKSSSTPVDATTASEPPSGIINSIGQKNDGSGAMDISITADDPGNFDVRAKLDYVAGSDCNFTTPVDLTIDTDPANVTSTYGTVLIDNSSAYQVGTSTGWITTASGANTVNFDWLSKTDLPGVEGTYCVRLTANNNINDQQTPATSLVTIDNIDPTVPGALTPQAVEAVSTPGASVELTFGTESSDTQFDRYRIFYKIGTSSVTVSDTEHSDENLESSDYGGAGSTIVNGLAPNTDYVFNIWAYDQAGNKTAASEVTVTTGDAAPIRANSVRFFAGSYYGNGTAGQNTNATNTLPAFNFKLAEDGLLIKNAYVILEMQFEAYNHGSAGSYGTSSLVFDACQGACTADALNSTSSIIKTDTSVLAFDETESNMARLLFDVTGEPELLGYAGNGTNLNGQIGYNLSFPATVSSIAAARATLVITYTYNSSLSDNLTKTVYYPLESTASGDSGSKTAGATGNCAKGSCPTFRYNMAVAEYSSGNKVSQWFETFTQIDKTTGAAVTTDVSVYPNIDSGNESLVWKHESDLGNAQPNMPAVHFVVPDGATAFAENASQTLEYRLDGHATNYTYYLMGGEVAETYIASSSAATKTRTVSFPLGVVNNGGSVSKLNKAVDVYFPENGNGSGNVTIKKAWFRIVSSHNASAVRSTTVSTKVGNNTETAASVYGYDFPAGGATAKPSFTIVHVASSTEYAELALANKNNPKTVTLYTTNNNADQGGVSAELVITYTYADEVNGYLASLDLFAGQSARDADTASDTASTSAVLFPEIIGTKTVRAAGLLTSFFGSDSDLTMPSSGYYTVDADMSSGAPTCLNAYQAKADALNMFNEFYKDVTASLSTTTDIVYNVCYSNTNTGDTSAGAKMNSRLFYTYQWNAPPPYFTQNDWRWYGNTDALVPTSSLADENTYIAGINLGDSLRLRMNVGVTQENMTTSTQSFKLQYALGSDCPSIAAGNWSDVGATSSTEAWRGYDNASVDDGDTGTTTLLVSSTLFESYESANNSVNNPKAISKTGSQFGEWDWSIYDYNATSSSDYCFRMIRSDNSALDSYAANSYAKLTTAAANTAPASASGLEQYLGPTGTTTIANGAWIATSTVRLTAGATDVNMSEQVKLYFEFIVSTSTFTSDTSVPAGACSSATDFGSCASKIWLATSTAGDYRFVPFAGSVTIPAIPDTGYKWQVLACDDSDACSAWTGFNASVPNLKIDTSAPSAPGALTFVWKTADSLTVNFGSSTDETNFLEYRIFYKKAASGVAETDLEHVDSDLDYIDYNSATSTLIINLSAGSQYVMNIWAYDQAGNKASATPELVETTSSSFTAPTGGVNSIAQKTDGSGGIDISIFTDDADNDDTLRAKVEYVEYSGTCDFTTPLDPTIDTDDASTYAYTSGTFDPAGDPEVDNASAYQVGTTTGWILTSPGASDVFFDWSSKADIPNANGTYCLRFTMNDGWFDQATPTVQMIIIDNVAPAAPGALTFNSKKHNQARLNFTGQSSDTHFENYRIFYSTSSPATESDTEHIDSNLDALNYNGATTTLVTGLLPATTYYFNIWAYDYLGNKASTTEVSVTTDAIPESATSTFQYKNDELTQIANAGWTDETTIKLKASANDPDTSELLTLYFQLIGNAGSFTTATSQPSGACAYGTDYSSCATNIWFVSTSTPGDYSVTPFTDTVSITGLPNSSAGYKWQVLACDDDAVCAPSWTKFNVSAPNFKVDTVAPTAPGALAESSYTSGSIVLSFGSSTSENNFSHYKIFYSTSSAVSENDTEHIDPSLSYQNYNGAGFTTVYWLEPGTTYYFNIWAYDLSGNKASSTVVSAATDLAESTPGTMFYTKNTRVLYYRNWNGTGWGNENTGPTFGSGAGVIRHVRSVKSDDGGKVGLVLKIVNTGVNPDTSEYWGAVYRAAANDFVSTTSLGNANANAYQNIMTADIAALSSGEFFVARNNAGAGTTMYRWTSTDGWTEQTGGPALGTITGIRLYRRPGTDNHVLSITNTSPRVWVAYYAGGANYPNGYNWVNASDISQANEINANYYRGEIFIDEADNTRAAVNYTGAASGAYTSVKYLELSNSALTVYSGTSSPAVWSGNYHNGTMAGDASGGGLGYLAGRDDANQLHVLKVDISTGTVPLVTTAANGSNISNGTLYNAAGTNYSYLPMAMDFYKSGRGLVTWADNNSALPIYKTITVSGNSLDAATSSVPGAAAANYVRVRLYDDPNENELLAVYQDALSNFSAVFWDGANNRFFNTTDSPTSSQVWTGISSTTVANKDDESISFAFTKRNSSPLTPTSPIQYKSDGTTVLANGAWATSSSVVLKASANDPDTSEVINLYFQFVPAASSSATSTSEPAGACASGTAYDSCASKIWLATSALSDYSATPFTGTTSITGIPDSASGYKWQVLACDDQAQCASWTVYNASTPNVKIDATAPSAPGQMSAGGKNSTSVTLNFGASSTEANFSRYRIYYSTSTPVTENHTEHADSDLTFLNYNNTVSTVVASLSASTTYYFNIWAYDLAGNKAVSTQISTTTNQAAYLRQVSYIFENDDGADVNSNTGAGSIDAALTDVPKGERLNLRLQVDNTGGDTAASKTYRLQYENQSDAPGTWVDVGAASQISYSSGLSGANGDVISSSKAAANGLTFTYGSWHENTNLTNSFTLSNGRYTEFVYAIHTGNAVIGKVYRFRLYNNTDAKILDNYGTTPQLTVITPETKRYSKGTYASLPATTAALTYYLDPKGYSDTASDNGARDAATSTGNYPVYNFTIATSTNTKALTAAWNGQSSISAASSTIYLQAYRFGAVNAWVTVASNTAAIADTDFDLSGNVNYRVSEYYDGSNLTYWRVYQDSGSQALRTDSFQIAFSDPVADVRQIHNRWRNDDDNETLATWRELEDYGDPTNGTSTEKLANIRLRLEVANTGGGSASNYAYRLEYAPTASNCASDPGGWVAMPVNATTEHFEMATSSNFADGDPTTAQLANAEGYTFTAGKMVKDPSNTASAITLAEDRYTEIEYVFFATADSTTGGTYCFRVTNAGTDLDEYDRLAELTVAGILNPQPEFLTDLEPSDNWSGLTSPTDYGTDVLFTGTATTTDGGDYYLAICKTNSITAGNDAPPTCNGGSWCISDLASSTEEANCSYTAATSSEELDWYGFACDHHAGTGIAKCSVMSQGSYGDAKDSPFVINHPPVFSNVYTSVNYLDPGQTFTIMSTSSDTDVAGGQDAISLYVCRTNSASVAGCTGGAPDTVCSVISTTTPNLNCNYTPPIPSASSTNTYYAFVYDSHGLGATSNSLPSSYSINNTVPELGTLFLNSGLDITLGLKGAPDSQISVVATTTDLNGCSGGAGSLVSATGVIYFSNVAGGHSCTANNNDCYQITSLNCALSGCVSTIGTYTCTASMKYFAIPTDGDSTTTNPYWSYKWLGRMTVFDGLNYSATTTPTGVEVKTTTALEVTEPVIDFGSNLFANTNTGLVNQQTTIVNIGNSPFNNQINGVDMIGNPSGTIPANSMKLATINFDWSATGTQLAIAPDLLDVNTRVPRPTSTTEVSKPIYWGIGIPVLTPTNQFTGMNTFYVVRDADPANW